MVPWRRSHDPTCCHTANQWLFRSRWKNMPMLSVATFSSQTPSLTFQWMWPCCSISWIWRSGGSSFGPLFCFRFPLKNRYQDSTCLCIDNSHARNYHPKKAHSDKSRQWLCAWTRVSVTKKRRSNRPVYNYSSWYPWYPNTTNCTKQNWNKKTTLRARFIYRLEWWGHFQLGKNVGSHQPSL